MKIIRKIFSAILISLLGTYTSYSQKINQISQNISPIYSLREGYLFKENIVTKGDRRSFINLKFLEDKYRPKYQNNDHNRYEGMFPYALILANRYNDSEACDYIYISTIELYKYYNIELDTATALFLLYYLEKGGKQGDESCIWYTDKLKKQMGFPDSATIKVSSNIYPDSYYFSKNNSVTTFLNCDSVYTISVYNKPSTKDVGLKISSKQNEIDEVVMLHILNTNDSMYYAKIYSGQTDSIYAQGWIMKSVPLYTMLKTYEPNRIIPVYSNAYDDHSIVHVINSNNIPETGMVKIVDISMKNSRVKVNVSYNNENIEGWIPLQLLCGNPYTTCS